MNALTRTVRCDASRLLLALAALLAVTTACSSTEQGASMDTSLTKGTAQARIFEHFTEVLATLPEQINLSTREPSPGMGEQDPGITVPCDDNDQMSTGPVNLQVSLWIHGIPSGADNVAYFEMISRGFDSLGWSLQRDIRGPQRIVRGFTRDGYALVAQLNPVGGMSLSGSSPCFPRSNASASVPQPSTVPHP